MLPHSSAESYNSRMPRDSEKRGEDAVFAVKLFCVFARIKIR